MSTKTDCIRHATPADAPQCLHIYSYYAENTAFSFEDSAPDLHQMMLRIRDITQHYPWLVYEKNHSIQGYAYASKFRPRPAYRWTVEVTVYLDHDAKGSGIAKHLYNRLFMILAKQGFFNAVAVITEPNPESEKFHQKMGFEKIGTFNSIGYKLDQWHDIGWWQKRLQPMKANPKNPLDIIDMNE